MEDPYMSDDMYLSRKQLINEQSNDSETAELQEKALYHDEIVNMHFGSYLKHGVLMQKWCLLIFLPVKTG